MRRNSRLTPLARCTAWLVMFLMLFCGMPVPLTAGTTLWDPDQLLVNNNLSNGAGFGGFGLWDNTTPSWYTGTQAPGTLAAWNPGDTATFWGTGGTVIVSAPVSIGGLTFNTNAYTLASFNSTNTLSLAAGTDTITLDTLLGATGATITSQFAGAGNLVLTGGVYGGAIAGTLTSNGSAFTWTGSYTGTTTINNGMTFALAGNSVALQGTTGITLNNGGILLTNTTAAEAALDRVANGATITSNGGTITVTNTVAAATPYSETLGPVALTTGQLNIVSTAANTGGTQLLTLGTGSLLSLIHI